MIVFGTYFTVWMGTLALGWSFFQADRPAYLWGLLGVAALWTWGLIRSKNWMPGLGLILFTLTAAAGLYQSLPFGWMFAGALSALISYDLSNFSLRLRYAAPTEDTVLLQRVHFTRLGVITLVGLALGTVSIVWQAQFSFEWMLFLMMAGVWGISLLVGWVRQNE